MRSMTAADKAELKEMINDVVSGRFDLLEYKLQEIKEQTTKTNGRVTRLEEKELTHVQNCPQAIRLNVLEDKQKGSSSINKWLLRGLAISASLVGIFWAVIQIIGKLT